MVMRQVKRIFEGNQPPGEDQAVRRRLLSWMAGLSLLCASLTTGCTTSDLLASVPESQVTKAEVGTFSDIRYWADEPPGALAKREKETIDTVHKIYGNSLRGKEVPITYLCISGGGSNGAFGAGFLVGWTARGDRPKFNVVTGISTGSMIAPLVFLGPKYDDKVKEAYTTISTSNVATMTVLPALLGRTAGLADPTPLKKLIAQYLTQSMLEEIAEESRKGRALLIGTTYLEAQRPIIWDIGAIARSGNPKSLDLVHQIILASASIPGAFPPANIEVSAEGKTYNEMHVDGGVSRQVFMYPPSYRPKVVDKAIGWRAKRTLYAIRNNKLSPEYADVKPSVFSIAGRSIDTIIKYDGIADLYKIYAVAQRDNVRFNYISIPEDFDLRSKEAFDKAYMNSLFQAGYNAALKPDPWKHLPPGM
jgi:predicted acylesterase/phospholipase RssA